MEGVSRGENLEEVLEQALCSVQGGLMEKFLSLMKYRPMVNINIPHEGYFPEVGEKKEKRQ